MCGANTTAGTAVQKKEIYMKAKKLMLREIKWINGIQYFKKIDF